MAASLSVETMNENLARRVGHLKKS